MTKRNANVTEQMTVAVRAALLKEVERLVIEDPALFESVETFVEHALVTAIQKARAGGHH